MKIKIRKLPFSPFSKLVYFSNEVGKVLVSSEIKILDGNMETFMEDSDFMSIFSLLCETKFPEGTYYLNLTCDKENISENLLRFELTANTLDVFYLTENDWSKIWSYSEGNSKMFSNMPEVIVLNNLLVHLIGLSTAYKLTDLDILSGVINQAVIQENVLSGIKNPEALVKSLNNSLNALKIYQENLDIDIINTLSLICMPNLNYGRYNNLRSNIEINLFSFLNISSDKQTAKFSSVLFHEFGHHIFTQVFKKENLDSFKQFISDNNFESLSAIEQDKKLSKNEKTYLLSLTEVFARLFEQLLMSKQGLNIEHSNKLWYFKDSEILTFDNFLQNYYKILA